MIGLQHKEFLLQLFLLIIVEFISSCTHNSSDNIDIKVDGVHSEKEYTFPSFITPIDQYYEYSIDASPKINAENYLLKITGAIENPGSFTLDKLKKLKMIDRTLTIECIHNPKNGNLISTAIWKGFSLYDFIDSLGLKETALGVKYTCADGYYTTHTIEEIKDNEVIGALYMNLETIPEKYGYPLRFINPGFYGVKNPGWVIEIEVLEKEIDDYWSVNGWETEATIGVDCKVFFPLDEVSLTLGDTVRMGGAAYGGKHIVSVEYSPDDGKTWIDAHITKSSDEDYVWVFWEAEYTPVRKGTVTIQFRAKNQEGDVQPEDDNYYRDGTNSRPNVLLKVL